MSASIKQDKKGLPVSICLRSGLPENTLSLPSGTTAGDGDCLAGGGPAAWPGPASAVALLRELADPLLWRVRWARGDRLGEAGTVWFCAAALCSPSTMLKVRGDGWKEENGELER